MKNKKAKKFMQEAVLVLRDQLNLSFSLIKAAENIVMIESLGWLKSLPHHKKKIVLHFSSMRHFADELVASGKNVIYYPLCEEVDQAFSTLITKDKISVLHIMEPSEWGLKQSLETLAKKTGMSLVFHENEQFLYQEEAFDFKKPPLLETFYRFMRKKTGVLMQKDKPMGGKWNFDKDNRKKAPDDIDIPKARSFEPDNITKQVIKEVDIHFPKHFGTLEGFNLACTRKEALVMLDDFVKQRLKLFGPYQDAMLSGDNVLFHSLLSPLLNIGLLRPYEVIEKVEKAYDNHQVSLESAEGFIRQILGWREYVYQVYKANMPGYKKLNFFNHKLKLPDFYWDAKTDMHCMSESIQAVVEDGINHHIQRLMVTGNFAQLAGIDPSELNDWYHFGYIDALDWVVTPNVLGLSQYADGGLIATKPYVSSAAYIHKMSNYCASCKYDPKTTFEENSCPFNALYWGFINDHQEIFKKNPRMSLMVELWNKKQKNDKLLIINRFVFLKNQIKHQKHI
jgi:deoxyribodipyrimidine photolyase-related protein